MNKLICVALIFMVTACGGGLKEQSLDEKAEASVNASASFVEEANTLETAGETNQESTEERIAEMKLKIQVGDTVFTATLAENSSVDALKALMADGPLRLNMSDYANMEKSANLGVTLPQNNEQMNAQAGDIILYQGRTLAIYYDTNTWSLTPIGKMDGVDEEALRAALGTGDVTVVLSLE